MALCLAPLPGRAETHILARAGDWQAFSTTSDDGAAVCGMASAVPGGRQIYLKHFAPNQHLTLQLFQAGWAIPRGTRLAVDIEFGTGASWRGAWHATGRAEGDEIEVTIPLAQVTPFLTEFVDAARWRIAFPGTTEKIWQGRLAGSTVATKAFSACLEAQASAPGPGPGPAPRPGPAPAPSPGPYRTIAAPIGI